MPDDTNERQYEAIKIHAEDADLARKISEETGLPIVHAVGAAIRGWSSLFKSHRERIVTERREFMKQNDRRSAGKAVA